MEERNLVAIVFKSRDTGCEVWFPDIPMDEPLLQELFAKYDTSGCSVAGDSKDIVHEISQALGE